MLRYFKTFSTMSWNGSVSTELKLSMSSVDLDKVGMGAAMFFGVLLASLGPLFCVGRIRNTSNFTSEALVRRRKIFVRWVSRLSCFAGGVFLATGFMDLYSDVETALRQAVHRLNLKTTFPLAPFLTLFGFFVILTIEQMILAYKEYHLTHSPAPPNQSGDRAPLIDSPSTNHHSVVNERTPSSSDVTDVENGDSPIVEELPQSIRCRRWSGGSFGHSIEGISPVPVLHQDCDEEDEEAPLEPLPEDHHGHHANEEDKHKGHSHFEDLTAHSSLRVVILLCAMSIHAVFEGLAVGLQSTKESVTELFVALCLHKGVIAAGIGLNLATSQLKRWLTILACFIFAAASPIGVFLGLVVQYGERYWGASFVMVNGILQGLACGTFFYVVFFEILPHEFNTGLDRMAKVLCLLLGFSLVCMYLLFIPGG